MNSNQRLFFVMDCLLKQELTIQEIQKIIKDKFEIEVIHRDINNDIQKLQELGFIIEIKPRTKILGKKFKIVKTIFNLELEDNEQEFIKNLFNEYTNNPYVLTSLFEKFAFMLNIDLEAIIKDRYFVTNKALYNKSKKILQRAIKERRKVSFEYKPINKEETLKEVYPRYIIKDEKKTERFLILANNDEYHELNIERIISEPKILLNEPINDYFPPFKRAIFKVYDNLVYSYHLTPNEKELELDIINQTKTIETTYFSEFRLKQKLLKYGSKAEIIHPKELREVMKEELIKALQRY